MGWQTERILNSRRNIGKRGGSRNEEQKVETRGQPHSHTANNRIRNKEIYIE